MNDRLKICRRILQTTGGVALLLWGGVPETIQEVFRAY